MRQRMVARSARTTGEPGGKGPVLVAGDDAVVRDVGDVLGIPIFGVAVREVLDRQQLGAVAARSYGPGERVCALGEGREVGVPARGARDGRGRGLELRERAREVGAVRQRGRGGQDGRRQRGSERHGEKGL